MADLGIMPGGANAMAYGVSADGTVIVGAADNGAGNTRAFRWTKTYGMVDIGIAGGKYKPSDFRSIGPVGKRLLKMFLLTFKGVSSTDQSGYQNTNKFWNLTEKHYSTSPSANVGRDVSISHTLGLPKVFYSSEYPGCGNGRYGLLVNKNEYLWIEDD
jgi:probable HAF family extracellular repeat protein